MRRATRTSREQRSSSQALEQLRERYDFDYRVVSNLPHAEALKLYADADLVIDQALAGWYMAASRSK